MGIAFSIYMRRIVRRISSIGQKIYNGWMQEYVSEAVVLGKEPVRDMDARYVFFTKRFGKIVAKATSVRKITSKLAGHLEPGTLVRARFIERNGATNGTRVVDALKKSKLGLSLGDLHLLSRMLHEGESDAALWSELVGETFSWRNILRILGWNPSGVACALCDKKPTCFYLLRQEFFCTACASKLEQDAVLLLGNERL